MLRTVNLVFSSRSAAPESTPPWSTTHRSVLTAAFPRSDRRNKHLGQQSQRPHSGNTSEGKPAGAPWRFTGLLGTEVLVHLSASLRSAWHTDSAALSEGGSEPLHRCWGQWKSFLFPAAAGFEIKYIQGPTYNLQGKYLVFGRGE